MTFKNFPKFSKMENSHPGRCLSRLDNTFARISLRQLMYHLLSEMKRYWIFSHSWSCGWKREISTSALVMTWIPDGKSCFSRRPKDIAWPQASLTTHLQTSFLYNHHKVCYIHVIPVLSIHLVFWLRFLFFLRCVFQSYLICLLWKCETIYMSVSWDI